MRAENYAKPPGQNPRATPSSETLADSANTSAIVVWRLLGPLREAGLVRGHPGRHGGASLARPPEEITLLDVYGAVDDPSVFEFSRNPPNPACPVGCCVTQLLESVFDGVHKTIEVELGRARISDLLEKVVSFSKGL
ncbi:Rrf2 family transcriptional regulator [Sorangium sp. So ce118]